MENKVTISAIEDAIKQLHDYIDIVASKVDIEDLEGSRKSAIKIEHAHQRIKNLTSLIEDIKKAEHK